MIHDDLAPFREQIEADMAIAIAAHKARCRPDGVLDISLIEASQAQLAADTAAAYEQARK